MRTKGREMERLCAFMLILPGLKQLFLLLLNPLHDRWNSSNACLAPWALQPNLAACADGAAGYQPANAVSYYLLSGLRQQLSTECL